MPYGGCLESMPAIVQLWAKELRFRRRKRSGPPTRRFGPQHHHRQAQPSSVISLLAEKLSQKKILYLTRIYMSPQREPVILKRPLTLVFYQVTGKFRQQFLPYPPPGILACFLAYNVAVRCVVALIGPNKR